MARCIDLFIDAAESDGGVPATPAGCVGGDADPWGAGEVTGEVAPSLARLAAELGAVTGLRLTQDPGTGRWVATVDGARVELTEHRIDRHLHAVSAYRYDLCARVASADALNSPEAALLRRILGLVKADGRYRAMLVWDLQNVADMGVGGVASVGVGAAGGDGLMSAG